MLQGIATFILNYFNYVSGIIISFLLVFIAFKIIKRYKSKNIAVIWESYFDKYNNLNTKKYIEYKGKKHILECVLYDNLKDEYYTVIDNNRVYLDI